MKQSTKQRKMKQSRQSNLNILKQAFAGIWRLSIRYTYLKVELEKKNTKDNVKWDLTDSETKTQKKKSSEKKTKLESSQERTSQMENVIKIISQG